MPPQVDCLLMPVIRDEWTALVRQLRTLLLPCTGETKPVLVISLDSAWIEEEKSFLLRVMEHAGLSGAFSGVEFFSCDIPAHESVYLRRRPGKHQAYILKYGWKSGPNIQFFRSVNYIRQAMPAIRSILLMETDLIPLMPGWLDALNRELGEEEGFLLAGARYMGGTALPDTIADHVNGNAVLNVTHPCFAGFIQQWERLLVDCMPMVPDHPYDVIIEWAMAKKSDFAGTKLYENVTTLEALYLPGRRYLRSIVNLGGPHESGSDYRFSVTDVRQRFPEMVLLHCRAAWAFADRLRSKPGTDEVESEYRSQRMPAWDSWLLGVNPGQASVDVLAEGYVRAIKRDGKDHIHRIRGNRAQRKIFEMVLNRCRGRARSSLLAVLMERDLVAPWLDERPEALVCRH